MAAACLASVPSLASGCASTTYQPRRPGSHIAISRGSLTMLRVGGGGAGAGAPLHRFAECDEMAREFALTAERYGREAQDLSSAALIMDAFFGPLLLGVVLRVMATDRIHASNAALVDTVNRYNDAESCVRPAKEGA